MAPPSWRSRVAARNRAQSTSGESTIPLVDLTEAII